MELLIGISASLATYKEDNENYDEKNKQTQHFFIIILVKIIIIL